MNLFSTRQVTKKRVEVNLVGIKCHIMQDGEKILSGGAEGDLWVLNLKIIQRPKAYISMQR